MRRLPPKIGHFVRHPKSVMVLLLAALAVAGSAALARADDARPGPPLSSTAETVYAAARPHLLQIRTIVEAAGRQYVIGSGFVVSVDGLAITNYHVVSQYALEPQTYRLEYALADGSTGKLDLLAIDVGNYLAVVRLDRKDESYFRFDRRAETGGPQKGERLFSMGNPNLIVNTAPALAAIAGAVQSTVVSAAFLGLVVLLVRRLPRSWMVWPAGAIALFAQLPLDIRTPGEFALQYGLALATVAASVAFCIWFGRTNYLAYALVFWALALRGPLAELFGTPIASLQVQGWFVAAALAAAVIWAVGPALGRKAEA